MRRLACFAQKICTGTAPRNRVSRTLPSAGPDPRACVTRPPTLAKLVSVDCGAGRCIYIIYCTVRYGTRTQRRRCLFVTRSHVICWLLRALNSLSSIACARLGRGSLFASLLVSQPKTQCQRQRYRWRRAPHHANKCGAFLRPSRQISEQTCTPEHLQRQLH